MVAHQAKKEIPWCTVCLVTGAIVAHSLVLMGNIATAKAMDTLGHSTGGWSDIGVTLSDSLTNELDLIMTNVTSVLTSGISALVTVQSSLDTVLGLAGSVTDTALTGFEKARNATSARSALLQANVSHPVSHPMDVGALPNLPKVGPPAGEEHPKDAAKSPNVFVQEEVFFMGQIGEPVFSVVDPAKKLVNPEHDLHLKNLHPKQIRADTKIPVFDHASVESLASNVMKGAMGVWKTAQTHAMHIHESSGSREKASDVVSATPTPEEFKIALQMAITQMVHQLAGTAGTFLDQLFEIIRPALLQIGKWVVSFGDKVTDKIESFMTSLDNVQKIFDQIMAKLSQSGGGGKEDMIGETYNLFDASQTGYISVADLQTVGQVYGVNALVGTKAEELFTTYDADGNGKIFPDEFNLFVDDPGVPNIMATVLRYYSKKLSTVSGNVAAARARDEVAIAVVEYFALVCAKNHTKVEWVSNALTNRSLPAAFSSDVMVQLAQNLDNPDQLTTVDIGSIVVREMLKQNAEYTGMLLALMKDATYWESEGYDPKEQNKCVERFTSWISNSPYSSTAFAAEEEAVVTEGVLEGDGEFTKYNEVNLTNLTALESGEENVTAVLLQEQAASSAAAARSARIGARAAAMTKAELQAMPARHKAAVEERQHIHQRSKIIAKRVRLMSQPMTPTVMALRNQLAIAFSSASGFNDPSGEEAAAINQGVPAKPETLLFAKYLASNSSATADRNVQLCFDYTSESSSPLDSFAVQIKNMIKKVQNFISLMQEFAGEEGINRIMWQIGNFTENAADDILTVIDENIEAYVAKMLSQKNYSSPRTLIEDVLGNYSSVLNFSRIKVRSPQILMMQQEAVSGVELRKLQPAPGDIDPAALVGNLGLGSVWSNLQYTLAMLNSALPTVIHDLKYARKEVSAVSSTLNSIFTTFSAKGPPIFALVAQLYKTLWVVYFVVFFMLTLGVLFYGMWASGFMGGPKAAAAVQGEEWYERPSGFRDRCRICCHCCDACLRGCNDSHLCFWSVIILFQIIVLVMFVVAIVLCLLAGIKAFITAGCAEVYLLGDGSICTGTLQTVQGFLLSFLTQGAIPVHRACEEKTLLACQLIGAKLKTSAIFTVLGSVIAAVLSFLMVTESAILHERARWRRIFDEETKRV